MSVARALSLALVAAAGAAGMLPAVATADRRGEQVGGRVGEARTTAELNADSLGRMPRRIQPTEHELEPHQKPPNPDSPPRADGGPRRRSASPRAATVSSSFNFAGPTLNDAPAYPPDTMGDVGPTQYIVMVNARVRSYAKATGAADGVLNADTDVFWQSVMTPTTGGVTSNFTSDPRIRFDRLSQRWIAVMIDVPNGGALPNRVMVAVSDSATVTPSTVWHFFWFPASATAFGDYPTLGIDANALYIGTNDFSTGGAFLNTSAFVVQKSSVLGAGPIKVTAFHNLLPSASGSGPYTPQGVDNATSGATTGYFVGVDNIFSGQLDINTVTDPGGTSPTLSDDAALPVPATAQPVNVPQSGGTGASKTLDALDDRLFAAQIRDGHLWTAHNIGVNSAGTASGVNRTGSRWYEISLSGTPSLVQSGTVFDSAASNARSYWIPSLAVNGEHAMVIGGSTAGSQAHPDAWFAGRVPTDAAGTVTAPTRYTAASANYNPGNNRWGDYSLSRVDPTDDQTFWTIQEYVSGSNIWGTRIARVLAPSPLAPTAATPSLLTRGQSGVHVQLTGPAAAGWFDPGSGFSKRLAVTVGCNIAVTSVTWNGPASIDVDLDTTAATRGTCDVTVTNPDGQSATATGLLATNSPPSAAPDTYSTDKGVELDGTTVLANDTDPDGDPLTAVVASSPAHGTLSLASDGTFVYTPGAGFAGSDSFTYRASDGVAQSAPATVSINVIDPAGNHAPVGVADAYSVPHDGTLNGASVLTNDTDADGNVLSAIKLTDPAHGTLSLASDGTFTYVAAPGFTGSDSFTYKATDGSLDSDPVTVTLEGPADQAPVAVADAYPVPSSGALDGSSVLANDSDADGDPLTAVKTASPAHGTVTLAPDGTFHYQAAAGFTGTDTFSYAASDGRLSSAPATVTLDVAAPPATGGGGGGGGGGGDSGGPSGATASPTDTTGTTASPVLTPPSLTSGTVVPIATPPAVPAPRCHVPTLRGHTVRYARRRLVAMRCAVGSIRKVTARGVKRGRVVRTLPKAGTFLPAGTRVAVRTAR